MTTATALPATGDIHAARLTRTLRAQKGAWSANAAANRGRAHGWVQSLWLDVGVKTGVLIAAGPSLAESIEDIRALDRRTHEIVAVDMALGYLLANGIVPDYVICADSSAEIARTLEVPGIPEALPLLASVTVSPATGAAWRGPIYWFCMSSNVFDRDLNEWMQREHAAASKVPSFLVPGGNVGSLGLSFLLGVRASPKVLLYGHDFCWADDASFYCGGVNADLARRRIADESAARTVYDTVDTLGRPVKTNESLVGFARWYAQRVAEYPGVIDNRTPVTILETGGKRI